MAIIALQKVSKTYNPGLFKKKVLAVSELSLEVTRGEVFGLIGPNGAGKSSTIRMLLGLIRPDSGSITFLDRPLEDADIQSKIGYLPENPYLYDHLTLEELLAFSGRASGLSSKETSSRGGELMEKLAMTEVRKRPLRTFSKGMLQRAGICFALLHDPSVVILDEPMSGLDPIGRKMVFDLVTDLKSQGKTIFFCSHILTDVERLCDRIGVMVGGRLIRILDRDAFAESSGPALHLLVAPLSEDQRRTIEPLVSDIAEERDHHVVSLPTAALANVSEQLKTLGVEIRGSRSDRLSLEEIFMQAVEENR